MACTTQEFKRRKTEEALELLYNSKAVSYQLFPKKNPNSIIITPSADSKIKTKAQARRAAESMLKKLDDKFGESYEFKTFGNWGVIKEGHNDFRVEIEIPQNLIKAYEVKEQQNRNIDYFNSDTALYEQEQREMILEEMYNDMPGISGTENVDQDKLNFNSYLNFKKDILQDIRNNIQEYKSLRIHEQKSNKKQINAKIRELQDQETALSSHIEDITKEENILEAIAGSMFNEDLQEIDRLLSNNNIENLQKAQKMIDYYKSMSDYSYINRRDNNFVNTEKSFDGSESILGDEIKEILDKIANEVSARDNRLHQSKTKYLQDLLDNSEYLDDLDDNVTVEELLESMGDIDKFSQILLTIDKQYVGSDSLLTQFMKIDLENARSVNKGYARKKIEELDAALKKASSKLPKIQSWLGSKLGEHDFTMFYQEDGQGFKTGRLINKLSTEWFSYHGKKIFELNKGIFSARASRNWEKHDKALENKYNWLKNYTNFFDITKVPEIINDERYSHLLSSDEKANSRLAEKYKQRVIQEIGENYYNKLVDAQKENLQDFLDWHESYMEQVLLDNDVESIDQLEAQTRAGLEISTMRNNPFELMRSHNQGKGSIVEYPTKSGNSPYRSQLKYIEYFPKKNITSFNEDTGEVLTEESGFYDNNFDKIEQDQDLYKLWQIFEEMTSYMNMTLSDSQTKLKHGSFLSMEKSWTDILIDPEIGWWNKTLGIGSRIGDNLKTLFTKRGDNKRGEDFKEINKSQFRTNEKELSRRKKVIEKEIIDLVGANIYKKGFPVERLSTASQSNLAKILGLSDIQELRETFSGINMNSSNLSSFITNQLMEEQTFNLPVMMRAYMEMTAEHKAQKEVQPKVSLYKEFYDAIERKSTNKGGEGVKGGRKRANARVQYWYDKNITGNVDQHDWMRFGKVDLLGKEVDLRVLDEYEKRRKAQLEEAIENLEERIKQTNDSAKKEELENKLNSRQKELDSLGANVVLSEIYNTLINRLAIFTGLGWSVKSNIINRFQGWFQGMVNDTGEFWTAGNWETANNFIMKKGTRFLGRKNYKDEINKTKLLINELGILQDATNELDRARKASGLTGWKRKINPFYLTEYTEWHNQVPQILAVLMDKEITSADGKRTVKLFDGKSLPAYEIKDGLLQLKEEFKTPENIETWQNFSNSQASKNKLYMSDIIGTINGDYSRTGVTMAKKTPLGRTAMLFKTWMSNWLYRRIASNQKNLITGKKNFDGFWHSHRPASVATAVGVPLLATFGWPVGLAAGGAGFIAGMVLNNKKNRDNSLATNIQEMANLGLAIVKKMGGMPINAMTGKEVVKAHQFDTMGMQVTEEDRMRLNSIVGELSVLLTFMLFKIMLRSVMGPNDEDEPLTIDGQPNPYYTENQQSELQKQSYNALENNITRIISDLNAPGMLVNSVMTNRFATAFDESKKMSTALYKLSQGEDRITRGVNTGESRTWNAVSRSFLPSVMADMGRGNLTLGFESQMSREFENSEWADQLFDSDYKEDREEMSRERSQKRKELTEKAISLWEENTGRSVSDLTTAQRKYLEREVKKNVEEVISATLPYPHRAAYDKDQNKKD